MELFPLRVATERFCNRIEERALLKRTITEKRPTVLISPRRYGKSSLALKVIEELALPFVEIDLLTAYDDDTICRRIIDGVAKVLSQILPLNLKTLQAIEKVIKGAKVSLNYHGIELGFASQHVRADLIQQMMDALEGLEAIASKSKKPVVFFIDEFQRVAETPKGAAIQGAVRHVAQKTKWISFLFSGSSRHLLSKIFEDSSLPLYMMCDKLLLERIHREDYVPYIQEAAVIQWKTELPLSLINRILDWTECHSFYVNFLCKTLWQAPNPPQEASDIDAAWHACYQSEQRRISEELEKLTLNQRVILKAIANSESLSAPTAGEFLSKIQLTSGTVLPALKALQAKDLLLVSPEGAWKVLDPLMRYFLLQ